MCNIIIYKSELKYQKNREELFLLLQKYDNKNKYYYFDIDYLEKILSNNNYDLKNLLSLNNENILNINHIFYYPRQIKEIDTTKNIYKLLINCPYKKSIFIDDLHNINYDFEILNNFYNKFMTYSYLKKLFFNNVSLKNVINCPHYLNDKFIYKNEKKDIQISILGHYLGDTYLTRKYIIKNAKQINSKLLNCSIKTYGKLNNSEYYKILRKSYASIATTGDNPNNYYPYIVSKYFEIPGSGALLIAHILPEMEEEMEKYGYTDKLNYLKFKNIDELVEICNYIYNPDNFQKVEEIRMNGFNLVKNNHLLSNRVKLILNIIN